MIEEDWGVPGGDANVFLASMEGQMRKTRIDLPTSAKEYLRTILGARACVHVMMLDGRLLKITYELIPRYDSKGNQLPETEFTSPPSRRKVSPTSRESQTSKTPTRRSPR